MNHSIAHWDWVLNQKRNNYTNAKNNVCCGTSLSNLICLPGMPFGHLSSATPERTRPWRRQLHTQAIRGRVSSCRKRSDWNNSCCNLFLRIASRAVVIRGESAEALWTQLWGTNPRNRDALRPIRFCEERQYCNIYWIYNCASWNFKNASSSVRPNS